jgi:hypothetical protein
MADAADRSHSRLHRRPGGGKASTEPDRYDRIGLSGDPSLAPPIQFVDVGFAEYQRLIMRRLEDIAHRIEKMQKRICHMDAIVDPLELCSLPPDLT